MDMYQLYAHRQTNMMNDVNETNEHLPNSPEDQQGRSLALDFSQRQPGPSSEQHSVYDDDDQADVQDYSIRSIQRQQSFSNEQVDQFDNNALAGSCANDGHDPYKNYDEKQPAAVSHYDVRQQHSNEHVSGTYATAVSAGNGNEMYAGLHAGGDATDQYDVNEDADMETDAETTRQLFGMGSSSAGSHNMPVFVLQKPSLNAAVSNVSMVPQPNVRSAGDLLNDAEDDTVDDDSDDDNAAEISANSSLNNNTINPEKPFKCSTCGRGFRLQTQLNSHNEIVHLKRRPFACKVCNIDFSCRGNFTKHCETKNHQKKAQELADAGAPVTPEMILTGDALKAHLAKMKAEARSSAKLVKTQATARSPPQRVTPTSITITPKKSPHNTTPVSTKLSITTAKNGTSAVRDKQNTASSSTPAPVAVSLFNQRMAAPGTMSLSLSRQMGNGGTVTSIQQHQPERIRSTTAAAGFNISSKTPKLDDVDEYERLVAELDACKATLNDVQKHCKKLQSEKEKLEIDHPVMRDRIDALAEQVRYKSCFLKKLDERKTALPNIISAGAPTLPPAASATSVAISNGNSPTPLLFSAQSDGVGTSDGSPSAFSSPSDVAAKSGETGAAELLHTVAEDLTFGNGQQNIVNHFHNSAMPSDDIAADNEAEENLDEMVLAPSQVPLG